MIDVERQIIHTPWGQYIFIYLVMQTIGTQAEK